MNRDVFKSGTTGTNDKEYNEVAKEKGFGTGEAEVNVKGRQNPSVHHENVRNLKTKYSTRQDHNFGLFEILRAKNKSHKN